MLKLSIEEIITKINAQEAFEAVVNDYSFTIKIEEYTHYVCAAIHDGHQFRKELWNNCLHSEYDRWYEEDPATKEMIRNHKIVIAGCDSRFEYDLNRGPESAVFETAWNKKLWKTPLSEKSKEISLKKHANFYKVVKALILKIEKLYEKCIVYDIHSYNWQRWDREVPTFNLGTVNIDNKRFGEIVENWRNSLSKIKFPDNQNVTSKINDTFQGNGYFLKFITSNFQNTLVLATEVKKIYCDELNQIVFPEVVHTLKKEFEERIANHANLFYKEISK